MKRKVYLAQINNSFGNNVFLPYSVGLLQAYAQSIEEIKDNYSFDGFCYLREDPNEVVKRWKDANVVGISVYIWNATISHALAKAIKEANPNCLVVMGGPHVPNRSEGYFQKYPYVDLLVHYEGEEAFAEILQERLKDGDFMDIPGLSVNVGHGAFKTYKRERPSNLDKFPSPYLTGVFEELYEDKEYEYLPTSEIDRGCPYSCTFCDWGSSVYTKLRRFSEDRLVKELEWFAEKKTDLLYNASSNFGIIDKDVELTRKMVELKKKTGFPRKFRAAYAKNSGERVYQISKLLNDAGMNKGVTLSFQSMDENTLEIVKRKNIGTKVFSDLMKRYRKEGIATYSEIIVGLPGETYDSFARGLNQLIESGQHSGINVYIAEMLPNSEMSESEYVKAHGIKFATVPVLQFHGSVDESDPHTELYDLVIETNTLSKYDWLRCLRLSWIVQCCHCLGATQSIAVFLHKYKGMSYREFYERLLDYADENPTTVIGEVSALVTDLFSGIPSGKSWGIHDSRFGNIMWPPEEGGFLKIIAEKSAFYSQLYGGFLMGLIDDFALRLNILNYQQHTLVSPLDSICGWHSLHLNYNIHEYLEGIYSGEEVELKSGVYDYSISPSRVLEKDDLESYAREIVWYGRKGGTMRNKVTPLQEVFA